MCFAVQGLGPDGYKYVGEYKNGKKHGTGTYTTADGPTITGQMEIW